MQNKALLSTLLILSFLFTCCFTVLFYSPSSSGAIHLIPVEPLSQHPKYPTGCEVITTITALRFSGENITADEFINRFLPCDNQFQREGIYLYGPDPNSVFVGNPYSTSSYGCFSSVIYQSLLSYFPSDDRVISPTNRTLEELCSEYIDKNIPVIIWASIDMLPIGKGQMWHLPNGEQFVWPSNEHCLLLVGYNNTEYFFCDPKYGQIISYHKDLCELRYAELHRQSIAILPQ